MKKKVLTDSLQQLREIKKEYEKEMEHAITMAKGYTKWQHAIRRRFQEKLQAVNKCITFIEKDVKTKEGTAV